MKTASKPTYSYVIFDGSKYLGQSGPAGFTKNLNRAVIYATRKAATDMLEDRETVVRVRVSVEKV